MTEEEREGTYRALPQIDDDVTQYILLEESGPVSTFMEAMKKGLDESLSRIDEELRGLADANPNLADILRGGVEGIYAALANELPTEQAKIMLREFGYVNAFVILRALDMQWRRMQQP